MRMSSGLCLGLVVGVAKSQTKPKRLKHIDNKLSMGQVKSDSQ